MQHTLAPVAIRPMTEADAAAVAALIRAAFAPLRIDPPPSALGETTESVAAQVHAGGGAVAEVAGRLAGAVLWQEREDALYLGRLAVDSRHRRRGIARNLIAAAEAEAGRRSLARLTVATRLVLTDNRLMFATCGFRETTVHAHEGYDHPTFVVLDRGLP
jgi:tRNA threonylcarbamoyladenosine biosynthesis protein TsaE